MSPFPVLGHEPSNTLEWEIAARNASGLLIIDFLRETGQVHGGPPIDHDECEQVLAAAAEHGVGPNLLDAVDAASAIWRGFHDPNGDEVSL